MVKVEGSLGHITGLGKGAGLVPELLLAGSLLRDGSTRSGFGPGEAAGQQPTDDNQAGKQQVEAAGPGARKAYRGAASRRQSVTT